MEFRPEYGRPPPEFYRGIDGPDYRDLRALDHRSHEYFDFPRQDFGPQRARSHTRLDPEFIPSDYPTSNRPLDKNNRSRSLDQREAFRDDYHNYDDRRLTNIPIYRERNDRNYDYERDLYTPFVRKDDRRGDGLIDTTVRSGPYSREIEIPLKRMPRALTRSTEWLSRRNNYDDRVRNPRDVSRAEGYSPKSASSSKRHNLLNLTIDPVRVPRREPYGGRSEDLLVSGGYGRENGHELMFQRDEQTEPRGGPGVNSHRQRQSHSNYHYESQGAYGSPSRRPITQQPMHHGPVAVHGGGATYRPIRHHRIRCCCFNFTWPPWSYEPTAPPQPLYRNI